jgi:hypothetical protein
MNGDPSGALGNEAEGAGTASAGGLASAAPEPATTPSPSVPESETTPSPFTSAAPPVTSPAPVTPPAAAPLAGHAPLAPGATGIVPPSVVTPPPRPRPPIVPERVEDGYRTERVLIDRDEEEKGWYVTIVPAMGNPQVIYCAQAAVDHMVAIARSGIESGRLWRALSDIPLERPLPSRQLEEELKALLTAFGNELRPR